MCSHEGGGHGEVHPVCVAMRVGPWGGTPSVCRPCGWGHGEVHPVCVAMRVGAMGRYTQCV